MNKTVAYLLVACMMFFVGGCSEASPTTDRQNVPTAPVPNEESRLMSYANRYAASSDSVATTEGLYELATIYPMSVNIMYYDYTTMERMYLCARPECKHNDESCNSYIGLPSESTLAPSLLYAGDKLILAKDGPSDMQNAYIMVANKDGTNRHMLLELDSEQTMNGKFITDGVNLYFDIRSMEKQTLGIHELVKLNIETGELTPIMSLDNGYYQIYGYLEKDILMLEMNQNMRLVRLNPNNPKEISTLHEWDTEKEAAFVVREYLYTLDRSTNIARKRNLKTDEAWEVKTGIPVSTKLDMGLVHLFEDTIMLEVMDIDTFQVENYYLDFEQKSVTPFSFLMQDGMGDRQVIIVGESGDHLCIIHDFEEHYEVMDTPTGEAEEIAYMTPLYAMVSKSDFLAGNSNYQQFEL